MEIRKTLEYINIGFSMWLLLWGLMVTPNRFICDPIGIGPVRLHARFTLSFRDVDGLLTEREIAVSNGTNSAVVS